jgi:hypothetical protein
VGLVESGRRRADEHVLSGSRRVVWLREPRTRKERKSRSGICGQPKYGLVYHQEKQDSKTDFMNLAIRIAAKMDLSL